MTEKGQVRIETRGEGGYVLGPGSPNECHHTGNIYKVTRFGARISEIPTLAQDERDHLLRVARTFDQRLHETTHQDEFENKGRPGDEFNSVADWEPILKPFGWKKAGTCGRITYWTRPDKKTGVSATTGLTSNNGLDLFCVFTTSCPEFDGPTGHSSCSVHTKFDTYCRLEHKGNHKAGAAELAQQGFGTKLEAKQTHWYTFAELAEMDWEVNYLVKDVLAENHNCIMFGPSKTLKTTIASELTICLATGLPFLGKFEIVKSVPVGIMSGESGKATMRDTFMRIAASKGLSTVENMYFSPTLPKLSHEQKLENLEKDILKFQLKVLILDPAYLCMNVGERESSLFAVGAVLNPFLEVCDAHEVTPVILHHTKQSIRPGRFCTLADLSWAGFEQIARQWITLNRKDEYEVGTGRHDLLCAFGGSMGHNSHLEINVDEGEQHDRWDVQIDSRSDEIVQEVFDFICEQDEALTAGELARKIQKDTGRSDLGANQMKKAIKRLVRRNRLVVHEKMTKRGKTMEAYSAITNPLSKRDADEED